VLFVHETHEVRGEFENEFCAALRDRWMPGLARDADARLLYVLHHAHGSGSSYHVATLTALRDAAAWGRLVARIDGGDLAAAARSLDDLRYDVTAKVLIPVPWSPLQQLDLAAVPATPGEHELGLFMEDTVWPFAGGLERYVERSGSHYAREIREGGNRLLRIEAGFRTAYAAGRRRESVLWQKVVEPRGLVPLLTREVPEPYRAPGTWMHDALELRDRWESRLLRTTSWSPWY
jgi:hypothetical protein